jgi:LEA14-like dessication related protein
MNAERKVVVVVLCCASTTGCATLQQMLESAPKPTITLRGVRFQGLTTEKVDLAFDVELQNPYQVPLPLVGLDARLASGGAPFLTAGLDAERTVPAGESLPFTVPVEVSFAETLKALSAVKLGESLPYAADLVFKVDTPTAELKLPIHHDGELWIPAPPRLQVPRVEVSELSMQQIGLELVLQFDSPNQVPLDLNALRAEVALAGVTVAQAGTVAEEAGTGTTRIEPGSSTTIKVPVRLSVAQVGLGLLSALRSNRMDYRVGGRIEFGTPLGTWSPRVENSGRAELFRP